jgi:hypothetical protein
VKSLDRFVSCSTLYRSIPPFIFIVTRKSPIALLWDTISGAANTDGSQRTQKAQRADVSSARP